MPGVAANQGGGARGRRVAATPTRPTPSLSPRRIERGFSKLALVGMSCQSSVPPVMWSRKIGKIGKPIVFNIGLLCSKSFDDSIFEELFWTKYGLAKQDMRR